MKMSFKCTFRVPTVYATMNAMIAFVTTFQPHAKLFL